MVLGIPLHVLNGLEDQIALVVTLNEEGIPVVAGIILALLLVEEGVLALTGYQVVLLALGTALVVEGRTLGHLALAVTGLGGKHLLTGLERHGIVILAQGLSPLNVALVAVQGEAYGTALQLLLGNLNTLGIAGLLLARNVEVLAHADVVGITGNATRVSGIGSNLDGGNGEVVLHYATAVHPTDKACTVGCRLTRDMGHREAVHYHGTHTEHGYDAGMRVVAGIGTLNLHLGDTVRDGTTAVGSNTCIPAAGGCNLTINYQVAYATLVTNV